MVSKRGLAFSLVYALNQRRNFTHAVYVDGHTPNGVLKKAVAYVAALPLAVRSRCHAHASDALLARCAPYLLPKRPPLEGP